MVYALFVVLHVAHVYVVSESELSFTAKRFWRQAQQCDLKTPYSMSYLNGINIDSIELTGIDADCNAPTLRCKVSLPLSFINKLTALESHCVPSPIQTPYRIEKK